ncbi:transcriptional regulator [Planctomycetaceae bacterium SCGC AG-212-D15]|nr:transcriptional regulator [Planctomycetaceae bacterium SCGC AG-212-D15]
MYIPTAFAETDPAKLHDFIAAHSFALLVSHLHGELFATHLPLLLDRDAGPAGVLHGHMARANPQWQELEGQNVLAVFSGPHAYVSPTWYEAEEVVPTWNYVAVHAYGTVHLVQEEEPLRQLLVKTVATYEQSMPRPWSIAPDDAFLARMARGVVGFRIEISRLEGKWKLNQNHPEERRRKVAKVLADSSSPDDREIARLIAEKFA